MSQLKLQGVAAPYRNIGDANRPLTPGISKPASRGHDNPMQAVLSLTESGAKIVVESKAVGTFGGIQRSVMSWPEHASAANLESQSNIGNFTFDLQKRCQLLENRNGGSTLPPSTPDHLSRWPRIVAGTEVTARKHLREPFNYFSVGVYKTYAKKHIWRTCLTFTEDIVNRTFAVKESSSITKRVFVHAPIITQKTRLVNCGLSDFAAATTNRDGVQNGRCDSLTLRETAGGGGNRNCPPHWMILWSSEQQKCQNFSEAMPELLDLVTRDILIGATNVRCLQRAA